MQPKKKRNNRKNASDYKLLAQLRKEATDMPPDTDLNIPEQHDSHVGESVVGLSLRFEDMLGDIVDVSEFCDALRDVALYDSKIELQHAVIPSVDDVFSIARFEVEMPKYPEDMKQADFIKFYKMGIQAAIDKFSAMNKKNNARGIFAIPKHSQFSKIARTLLFFFKASTQNINQFLTLSPSVLASNIANYFQSALELNTSYTVPELAYAAGFASRRDMLEFLTEHYDTPNGFILSRAMTIIEAQRNVEMIASSGIVAGHKEDLQSNFNWGGKKKADKADKKMTGVDVSTAPPQTMTLDEWTNAFHQNKEPEN